MAGKRGFFTTGRIGNRKEGLILPNKESHLSNAMHNKNFFEDIIGDNSEYYDWSATVIFYCAVHLVEAYFAEKNVHHFSHSDRKDDIYLDASLNKIKLPYKQLESLSRSARYDCVIISKDQIDKTKSYLEAIEKYIPK